MRARFGLRTTSRAVWTLAMIATMVVGGSVYTVAQQNAPPGDGLRVVKVQPNFYMIAGAGSNIGVQVGTDGVVLVDAGAASKTEALLAAVKSITDKPIRYIIDTGGDADHVGGNENVAKAGSALSPGAGGPMGVFQLGVNVPPSPALIISTENLYTRMSAPAGTQGAYPVAAWPSETFTRKQKVLYLNGEGIQVLPQPAAHTDGDSIVFFRRSDVIATGDIFDKTRFPAIDIERGGSIQGEIDALNRIIELAVPAIPLPWQEGGTRIVPGHGRVSEQAELVEYRDMVTIVRDRVQDLMKSRMTLDQIKAASPTKGWTGIYGRDSANPFVEAIYRGLTPKPAASAGGTAAKAPKK